MSVVAKQFSGTKEDIVVPLVYNDQTVEEQLKGKIDLEDQAGSYAIKSISGTMDVSLDKSSIANDIQRNEDLCNYKIYCLRVMLQK